MTLSITEGLTSDSGTNFALTCRL